MSDLLHQQFSPVQSNMQPQPVTLAVSAVMVPTTALTFVTGTVGTLATITPPVTGFHILYFVFSGAGAALNTTGNILAGTVVTNVPVMLLYNPITGKYWPKV